MLLSAIGRWSLEGVKLLLSLGADPNEQEARTLPLFLAIAADGTDGYQIVQTLIEAEGINVDVTNENGLTLKEYAKKRHPDVVKVLEKYNIP